jgi:hypothetical protein
MIAESAGSVKGSVGAVFGFDNRIATNRLCRAARFIVKKQITGQAYPRQFNVHTSLILLRDIVNNGEFVGFTNMVNEFEDDLTMNWIIRMHYIDSIHQLRMRNVIGPVFENDHDEVNI